MRRNLFVIAGALALAVAAVMLFTGFGLAQAHPPADGGPNPLVDVDTTIDTATEDSAEGTITVCNVSEDGSTMTIETVDAKLSYKEGGGDWTEFDEATVSGLAPGTVLRAKECAYGSWEATYDLEGANRISIEAQVTVEQRLDDKVFIARACSDVVP